MAVETITDTTEIIELRERIQVLEQAFRLFVGADADHWLLRARVELLDD